VAGGCAGTIRLSRSPGLTPRERDCLSRAARGLTDAETAAELGVPAKTVEHYMAVAGRRWGAFSTTHAVGIALHYGLLRSGVRLPAE
jgi:DNA-binding CsgD family transcriptional regulator